jgi:putative oxidoreductase
MRDWTDLFGRILLSGMFLFEAYDSIKFYDTTQELMVEYGLTWKTEFLLNSSIVALLLGGFMILLGYRPKLGAGILLLYWLPVTFIRHSFWNDPVSIQREQTIHFVKNMAIVGGLIIVLINGTGRFSIRKLISTTRV